MRFLGLDITLAKKLPPFSTVPDGRWYSVLRGEPWGGAWQSGIQHDDQRSLLGFSPIFACVTLPATDIAKLRVKLVEKDKEIWQEIDNPAYSPLLRKPNSFQNMFQFLENWIICKLLYGNVYAIKTRDQRRVVTAINILHPEKVKPLITEEGDVWYQLSRDDLQDLRLETTVPASEIIHDRMNCLWHPLVGVSPLYAAAMSATMGNKIQNNSSVFFKNMSRPSGMLTAPGLIPDELAGRLKKDWEENYGGQNIGRIAVAGSGLEFKVFDIPAQHSQLVEQLGWTVNDIARAFHVPAFKIGGPLPPYNSVEALNQVYYSDCLQGLIEAFEICMDEGLSLPANRGIELDLSGLLRMDSKTRAETNEIRMRSGELAPNEARQSNNLPPVDGGYEPLVQEQNWPLSILAQREAPQRPPTPPASTAPPIVSVDTDKSFDTEELHGDDLLEKADSELRLVMAA